MPDSPRVGLFVTCLVDLFRPRVGFASVRLLERAGCAVEVPAGQTCCGQPAYNSGALEDTRAIAEQAILAFEGYDHVVVPSVSCAGQIREYPGLFEPGTPARQRAEALLDLPDFEALRERGRRMPQRPARSCCVSAARHGPAG